MIKINSEILEYQLEKKKVKEGVSLSSKGSSLQKAIEEKKEALEEALKCLEGRQGYITNEKMEKTVQLIKDNIVTAENVLKNHGDDHVVSESELNDAKNRASDTIQEVEDRKRQAETEMRRLTLNLSS